MMEISPLNLEHVPAMMDICRATTSIMGEIKYPTYDRVFEERLISHMENKMEFEGVYLGAFESGQLISYMAVYFWPTLPFYTLANMKVRPGFSHHFNIEKNGIAACFDIALSIAEARQRYQWFMLRSAAHPYRRTVNQYRKSIPRINDYEWAIDQYVPADTESEWEYVRAMMAFRKWSVPLYVMSGYLKTEYRMTASILDERG